MLGGDSGAGQRLADRPGPELLLTGTDALADQRDGLTIRREKSRCALQDRVRPAQLTVLGLQLPEPLGFLAGYRRRSRPVSPRCAASREGCPAPQRFCGSGPSAIRVARSLSSKGYFLGTLMPMILRCIHCIQQTRTDSDSRSQTSLTIWARSSVLAASRQAILGGTLLCHCARPGSRWLSMGVVSHAHSQVQGDPTHRRPGDVVQVHRRRSKFVGVALPDHAQIISLSSVQRLESACINNRYRDEAPVIQRLDWSPRVRFSTSAAASVTTAAPTSTTIARLRFDLPIHMVQLLPDPPESLNHLTRSDQVASMLAKVARKSSSVSSLYTGKRVEPVVALYECSHTYCRSR